jgi:hypothetical protein
VSGGAAPTVTLGSVMLVARVVAAPSLHAGDQHGGDARREWGDLGGGFVSTHHR